MGKSLKSGAGRPRTTSGNVTIREMELKDLPKVFDLGERLFTAEKWPTLYRAWDEYEVVELYGSDGEFCLVAEIEDRLVGFALGTLMEKYRSAWRYGWLLWLGVSPRLKGKGVATRLLNRLTELFIENDARMMLVDTDADNGEALGFFRKRGFSNELQHIYLSRTLDDHPLYVRRKAEQRSAKGRGRRSKWLKSYYRHQKNAM
jgi:ribosomal protein S18 acetylase RimI-like enzyme